MTLGASSVTVEVARHLEQAAAAGIAGADARLLREAARRLAWCAEYRAGCGHPFCPRCQATKAKRYRKAVEQHVRDAEARRALLALVTLTVAPDDLVQGHKILTTAFAAFRRTSFWTSLFVGGAAFIQTKPSDQPAARDWNVHVHAVTEIAQSVSKATGITARAFEFHMQPEWRRLVQRTSGLLLVGSCDVKLIDQHWVPSGDTVISLVAGYASKRARSDLLEYTPEQLVKLVHFWKRRRLALGAFGTWRPRRR
jgi:hypothetical protein